MTQPISDGFVSTAGGCHTGIRPALLSNAQYARGVNITSRGGQVGTRPRYAKVTKLSTGSFFNGAAMYRLNETDRLVYAVDGNVKVYNLKTGTTADIGSLNPTSLYHFTKADRYFIVQDGESRPLIVYEDELLRQAIPYRPYVSAESETTYNEVFTGLATAYGHGRVFTVARRIHNTDGTPIEGTEGRPYFVAGDILDPSEPERVLRFTETNYLDSGAAAVQPLEMGFITSLQFYRNTQTGTGQGPLISFARYGVAAYSINLPRNGWGSVDFSQVLFFGAGCQSPWSITSVNDDLLYRSADGIRSLRHTTQREAGGGGNLSATPISSEVSYFLDMDNAFDLKYAVSSFADNRFLLTSAGFEKGGFRGILSLDTAVAYSLSDPSAPIYDGVWTGFPTVFVGVAEYKNRDTHYMVAKAPEGYDFWRLDDEIVEDNGARPLCRLYTREYNFENAAPKRFEYLELYLSDIQGDLDVTAYFRTDGYKLWSTCNTQVISTDTTGENVPQSRYRVRLSPEAEYANDEASGRDVRLGLGMQFCIEWKGHTTLEKVLFFADPAKDEPPDIQCDATTSKVSLQEGLSGIILDDFTYDIYSETGETS